VKKLLAALFLLLPGLAHADFAGQPMVMNGDTMRFGESEISLYGVHAPMITQSCGEDDNIWSCGFDAAIYLEDHIGTNEVVCTDVTEMGQADDGTLLFIGRCTAAGEDLAGVMIDAGLAVPDEDYGSEYMARAMEAEEAERGMWSGPFVDPLTYAEYGGCSCSARKKAMLDNAQLLQEMNEAEDAEETN